MCLGWGCIYDVVTRAKFRSTQWRENSVHSRLIKKKTTKVGVMSCANRCCPWRLEISLNYCSRRLTDDAEQKMQRGAYKNRI